MIFKLNKKWVGLSALLLIIGVGFFVINNKSTTHNVVLTESGFEPRELTIKRGDTIEFSTVGGIPFWPASDPHPLHTTFSAFDPKKPINPGQTWKFKFYKLGDWNFHDHLYPAWRGKVTVLSKNDFENRNKFLNRDSVSSMIDKLGPAKAYSSLKNSYDPSSIYAHTTFHIFGEVLYAKFKLDGIDYCDNFAGFGCYHGLFIKAVSDKGLEAAIDLDKRCVSKFGVMGLGCPHGIGHGLVEYYGIGKIKEPLAICAKLTWQGPFFGCVGGVFMENNFPTVFDKNGVGKTVTREPSGNVYEPCLNLSGKYRRACYFEQAAWWISIYKADYSKVGSLCSGIKNQLEKEACLLGMGNSIAETSSYNYDTLSLGCSKLPSRGNEAICRAGGAWAFFSNPDKRSESDGVCKNLSGYEKLCLEKMKLVK